MSLGGMENEIAQMLSGHLTNYNDDWNKISEMHEILFDEKFRTNNADTQGNPWVFSWHCLDHVGYTNNPRRRDLGHHKIFDYYQKLLNNKRLW